MKVNGRDGYLVEYTYRGQRRYAVHHVDGGAPIYRTDDVRRAYVCQADRPFDRVVVDHHEHVVVKDAFKGAAR